MSDSRKTLTLFTIVLLVLGACASQQPPDDILQSAKSSIASAEAQNAFEHAPLALRFAKEKLAAAQLAVERRRYDEASRFAKQAQINCELAVAKTAAAIAREASRKQEEANRQLKLELGEPGQ